MNNVVEKLNTLEEYRMRIILEHKKFNLERFLLGYGTDGAIALITQSQFILTDCFVKKLYDYIYTVHGWTMEVLYLSLYNESKKIDGDSVMLWKQNIIDDNNIYMQFFSGYMLGADIGIPNIISENQYYALENFNDRIKVIYNNNKHYFDNNPMLFGSDNFDVKVRDLNNIDNILIKAKERIGTIEESSEVILGDNIEHIKNNLLVKKRIIK